MPAKELNLVTFHPSRTRSLTIVTFGVLFFMWGLITVLNFVFTDHLVFLFGVDYSLSTLMNLTFFGAYLIVSIFAGKLISKVGYKKTILTGWIAATAGCFVFNLAVHFRLYSLFLIAMFILAGGITILQVSANLYIVLYGRSDNSASRLNFVQAFNSLGTMLAPFMASFFLNLMVGIPENLLAEMKDKQRIELLAPYVHYPYLFLGILMTLFAVFLKRSEIPNIKTSNIEPLNKITSLRRRHVMHFPQLRLGAFAIFAYVGAEVALASYLGTFAEELNVEIYWTLALAGRFIGAFALVKFSPHKAVGYAAAASMFLVLFAAVTFGSVSVWAVTLVGLFNSVLFPTIFALGVNGLGKYSDNGSSVLIMFIVGGAIIPFMVNNFSFVNYHVAFLIPIICYFYISLYGFRLSKFEREETVVETQPMVEVE